MTDAPVTGRTPPDICACCCDQCDEAGADYDKHCYTKGVCFDSRREAASEPPTQPATRDAFPNDADCKLAREIHKIFCAGIDESCTDETEHIAQKLAEHRLAAAAPTGQWVKVEEWLPEDGGDLVLVMIDRSGIPEQPLRDIGWVDDRGWHTRSKLTSVTHWQPLPAPPVD